MTHYAAFRAVTRDTPRRSVSLALAGILMLALPVGPAGADRGPLGEIGKGVSGALNHFVGLGSEDVDAATISLVGPRESGVSGQDAYKNLSLDQCIRIALTQYPPLINQRESLHAAESAYRAARGDFLPVLDLNAAQQYGQQIPNTVDQGEWFAGFASASVTQNFKSGGSLSVVGRSDRDDRFGDGQEFLSTVSVDLEQPLLEGFGRDIAAANLRIAEINMEITRYGLTDFFRSHILRVTQQYHSVFERERLLQVQEESLVRARESLRRLKALVAEGEVAEIDIATQELQVAEFEESATQALNSYNRELIGLRLLLGVPPDQIISLARSAELEIDFELDEPAFTPRVLDVEEAKKQALARRLDYLQEKRALEIREIAVATSRNVLLPDLSFFASLGLTDNGSRWKNTTHFNQGDWVTGLQVQVPFGLVREREQYTQAKISLRQAKNSFEQSRRRILNEVENTVRDVETFELTLRIAYRRVKNAQLSAAGAEVMYEIGEINVFDRSDAQAKLSSAEANYVSLFLNYRDALDTLDFVIGEPVEERYGVSL